MGMEKKMQKSDFDKIFEHVKKTNKKITKDELLKEICGTMERYSVNALLIATSFDAKKSRKIK